MYALDPQALWTYWPAQNTPVPMYIHRATQHREMVAADIGLNEPINPQFPLAQMWRDYNARSNHYFWLGRDGELNG